ncbi:MAG TPA: hypothetical protein VGE18_00955 [Candidatus Paceibacterota bacterium]
MKEIISILGYRTESVSIKDTIDSITLLNLSTKEQCKIMLRKTWWVFLVLPIGIFILLTLTMRYLLETNNLPINGQLAITGMLTLISYILLGTAMSKQYIPDRNEELGELKRIYKAFVHDLLSLGIHPFAEKDEPLMTRLQRLVISNNEIIQFIKKTAHFRTLPKVKPRYCKNTELYDEYAELYKTFQEFSSFSSKLTF